MVNTKIRLIIFLKPKMTLQSQQKQRLGADCDLDHELLIAKFRLRLNRVRKTTTWFRYDLNQIPYNYTLGMTNEFKGLDLKNRVPGELWMEIHNIVQEAVIKTIPKEIKDKMIVWGGLMHSWEKKRSKEQRRKGNIHLSECKVSEISKEI